MEIYWIISLSIIFFLAITLISQLVASKVVGKFSNKILETAEDLKIKNLENEKYKEALDKEFSSLGDIEDKKKRLGFITIIIGVGEVIIFSLLTLFLIKNSLDFLGGAKYFFSFLGGWLAIKTLGNYQQWAGPIFGRACFYTFFIGTFLNILFSVVLGFLLFYISNL
jgi:hypothetical protein